MGRVRRSHERVLAGRPRWIGYDHCCEPLRDFTYDFDASFEYRGWWIFKSLVISEFHM